MPNISEFYGITIWMYGFDNQKHKTPHIHAEYSGKWSVYSIETGELLEGERLPGKNRKIKKWTKLHKDELMDDWTKAINGKNPDKISPLK